MAKGAETRERILERAYRLAARDGLDGLSLSTLASEAGMSKSGLFAHFQSKEDLQVDVLKQAALRFQERVWKPALDAPRGEPRIKKLFDAWLRWVDEPSLPGGCLFLAASVELDDQRGRPRDTLVQNQKQNIAAIAKAAQLAIEAGHFSRDVEPEQFAYELDGILFAYNHYRRLLEDKSAHAKARKAFTALLERSRA